jgi:septal ring factor EnvC (AmiA/AmiB activator)
MSTRLEAIPNPLITRTSKEIKPQKNNYFLLISIWLILIGCGVVGAMQFTNHVKKQIASEISAQTHLQLDKIQEDYQKQITDMKDNVSADILKLQTKIDSLNELMAFTKDSASNKTDNSNQLYTQLADVKKKLDELQKNLDVLK